MVEYLDPEIAGEGESADAPWQPFIAKPVIPTYDGIKSIRKYFPQYSGVPYKHRAFPCWLYHPTKDAMLVSSPERAKQFGATWRQSSHDEKTRGFPDYVWDYTGEWRAMPFSTKADVTGTGKNLIVTANQTSQSDMIGQIVAAVTAQLALKPAQANALAPMSSDPDYEEFQRFKAWKASKPVDGLPVATPAAQQEGTPTYDVLPPIAPEEEKKLLIEAAKSRAIDIDKRWGIDRIKQELDKFE